MKVWERPAIQLLALFVILGLLTWWTFRAVSMPPSLRNLFKEDQAIAAASLLPGEAGQRQQEVNRLPPPPNEQAPEVASLLIRLQNLPALPYLLQVALARDANTPPGESPPAWNEAEWQALREARTALLKAWEPFFSGPTPDWKNFPDSILLFRSRDFPMRSEPGKYGELLSYVPGRSTDELTLEAAEFYLSYARQTRGLGAIRFGWALSSWNQSETIRVADFTTKLVTRGLMEKSLSLEDLRNLLEGMPAAPTLGDLRNGLEGDRSLFLRAANYLESLPSSTPAKAGLFRLLQDQQESDWFLQQMGQPATAPELAARLRRDAGQLDLLREKTFLPGPAWRQWLSGDPGAGLSSALANGMDGFREFEKTRAAYLFAQAALQARVAWEQGDGEALRRIPDPNRTGSFLRVEETKEGMRVSAAAAPGETNPLSILLWPRKTQKP